MAKCPIKILCVKDYEDNSVSILLVFDTKTPNKELMKDAIRAYDSYFVEEDENEEKINELVDLICKNGSALEGGNDEYFIVDDFLFTDIKKTPQKNSKDSIRGIFFPIDKFVRDVLSKKSEQELYNIASENSDCAMYTLDEISEMANDEMLPDFNNWIFFVDLDNVKQ